MSIFGHYGIALDFILLFAGVGPPFLVHLDVSAAISALLFRTFASNLDAEHILTMYLSATWDSCSVVRNEEMPLKD